MKTKSTKSALLMSFTSLLLCIAMLIGCTFAWFTDSVTANVNKIVSGNLDIEVSYEKPDGTWTSVQGADTLFSTDLWEPGHTEYITLKIENKGTLAFKYQVEMTPVSESGGINVYNEQFKLSDYLVFATTDPAAAPVTYADRAAARAAAGTGMALDQASLSKTGEMLAGDAAEYITLVVYMPETVGNEANYKTGTEAPFINLGITVLATQLQHEFDSFDNTYDGDESTIETEYVFGMPAVSEDTPVSETGDTVLEAKTQRSTGVYPTTIATVTVPEGSKAGGAVLDENDRLKLTVTPGTEKDKGITVDTGSSATTYDVELVKIVESGDDVKVESAAGNPIKVKLQIGVVELQEFYHHDQKLTKVDTLEEVTELGLFYYDVDAGDVTFLTDSFSPFTSVYKYAGGLGTKQHPYLLATAGHWVEMCGMNSSGSMTQIYKTDTEGYLDNLYFTLIEDIDLAGVKLPNCVGIYFFHLDGYDSTTRKYHKVSNATGSSIFSSNDTLYWYYGADNSGWASTVKNLTLENCTTEGPMFGYGTYGIDGSSKNGKVVFTNVDANNCNCGNNGAVFGYCGSGKVDMTGCDFKNVNVQGFYFGCGGFIGNISTGELYIQNCSFDGTISSDSGNVGGFVGAPNTAENMTIIYQSEISENTVIRSVGGGCVGAFDGSKSGVDYGTGIMGSTCKAKLQTTGAKYTQGTEAAAEGYTPVCTAEDFVLGDDGTLTYNGEATLNKVVATQQLTSRAYIYISDKSGLGGYNAIMETVKTTNVHKDDVVAKLTRLNDIVSVVSEGNNYIGGHTTTDKTNVNKIVDNTYYLNSLTYGSGDNQYFYYLTQTSNNLEPIDPESIPVYVRINVFEDSGAWEASITGAQLTYNVPICSEQ